MIRANKSHLSWLIPMALLVVSAAHAQQPLLQITSPSNLSLIPEGQVVTITVSADPSVQNIWVLAQSPLPEVQPTSNPDQFTLTLPTNLPPGLYQIGAIGSTSSGDVESAPVLIDVERQDAPISIIVQPTFFTIQGIGGQTPIPVYGMYADGTSLNLSYSTQTGLVSSNTAIATVSGATSSSPGMASASAVGAGETSVVVSTYATGSTTASATATIWVTVTVPPPGPAPVITSVSTNTGTPGVTQVTVNGSNFGSAQGSGYLELGSRSATTISLWTPSQINATVPVGSMPGVVLVKQNGLASNKIPFTTVVPSITGVSPPSGATGALITISGSNFGTIQNSSQVMFNHVGATPKTWADGSITAPVPVGATTGTIVVFVNGTYSNAVPFTVPAPVIKTLTPDQGTVGTPVTISGNNFAAKQNTSTVTFSGIIATPTKWAGGSITVPVPSGATTGPVVVTVSGIASNGPTFWVNSASDFTGTLTVPAIGATGPATQVPTSGNLSPGQNASLTFNGTAGQALSFNLLNSTIGSAPSSCTATLYDSLNNNIGSGLCGVQTAGWMGPIALTSTGVYRLYLVPNGGATGSLSVSVNNDSDVTTPAISIGGSAVTTTTTIAGQDVRLSFTATAAQHIGVYATNVTNPAATLYVLSTTGSVLASTPISSNPAGQTFFVDTQLAKAGTYQVWIQHNSTNIGSETLQIVAVPSDFMGTLAVPAAGKTGAVTQVPKTGSLAVGQNAKLTFNGTAGQKLSFNVSNSTIGTSPSSCLITISDPTHNQVGSGYCGAGASYVDTVTIATTGTYTFYIDPQGSATGSVGISVNNDQDVTTPAITIGGSAVTATTVVAGQDVRLSFTAAAPRHIVVSATNVTNPAATMTVLLPSGSILASTSISNSPGQTFSVDTQLTAAGTYQLWIQHSSTGIGSETLQIVGGPPDFTGTLTVPAPGMTGPPTQVPTTGNLATDQNASLTFSGSGGQKLSFNVLNSTIGTYSSSCLVTIYDPSRNIVGSGYCGTGASYIDTVTLASTGTYTFSIAPQGSATGSVGISVNNDQDVTTPGISIGGSAVTATTVVAGQDVRLSFTTTGTQHLSVSATNVTNPSATLNVVSPSGSVVASTSISNNPAGQTFSLDTQLTPAVTYQLWIGHSSTSIGSETLQIVTVPADFTGTLTVPAPGTAGPPTQVPTTGNLASGQRASLTFSGSNGQKLSFNVLNSTIGTSASSCLATIYDPRLNVLGSGYCGKGANYIDTVTLASTGTYTFYLDPQTSTGNVGISINNDQDVTTPAITIGGSAVTATTSLPGQDVRLSFTAAAAQHISVYATNVTNPSATLSVLSPSGSVLSSTSINNNPAGQTFFVDTQLTTAGTYQLWVQHYSTNIGSETLQITGVPADFTGTLTVPAPGTTGATTQVPTTGNLATGQNASLTFAATAGQRMSFNVLNSTIGTNYYGCLVTIFDPTHKTIGSGYCGLGSNYVNTVTLASTGTYTFYIDPQGSATGSVGISVNNDQDVTTPAISIGGSAVTATTTVAGQDVRLNFTATASQHIGVYATNVTNPSATLSVISPSGSVLASISINNNPAGQTFFVDTQLATAGTYQLLVQHYSTNIGSETLQITGVPADFTGTLTVPAPGTTGPTTQVPTSGNLAAGQKASLTFAGTAGQKLSFNVLNSTLGTNYYACLVTIFDPTQKAVGSGYCGLGSNYVDTLTLASTGTYTFYINPQGSVTGSASVSINNDQDVTTPAISIGGSAVTATTTVAGQDVRLSFTATASQHIGVYATNVTNPSATLSVILPSGSVLASMSINNNPAGQIFFVDAQLPTAGTYQLWVQHYSTNIGSETLQIIGVPPDFTGTLTVPAPGTTGPTTQVPTSGNLAAGQKASLTFAGTAGQKFSFNVVGSTIGTTASSCAVTIYDPAKVTIGSGYCGLGSSFIDTVTLASTGNYTFYINPNGAATGSVGISINNDQDLTGTITIDGPPVTAGPTVVGQDVRLSFSTTTANQRVVMYVTAVSNPDAGVLILNPDGSQHAYMGINKGCNPCFMNVQTLATVGTYTVWVNHHGTNVGSETIQLNSTSDLTGTITLDGPPVTVGPTVVGQDVRLSFSTTTANQRVVMYVTAVSNPDAGVLILNPDGSQHAYMGINKGCNPCFMNVQTLATVGTYTVWVNHHGTNVGSETIQLNSVPADVTGTITVDGGAVTTTTTATGQSAFLTFSGTAGQRLYMDITNLTGTAYANIGILDPNGNWVTRTGQSAPNSTFNWYSGLLTLSLTGTYKVAIEPTNQGLFGATFQLVTVPADLTGTITVDGGPVTTSTTAPGQKAYLTFSGTAGQRLYMDTTNLTGTSYAYFGIRDPNGNWVTYYGAGTPNSSFNWYTGLLTLSLTGTYKVAIEPNGMGVAGATFQLVTVPADLTGTITVNGGPVAIATTAPGQRAYLTFNGTSGETLYLLLNNPTGSLSSSPVGVLNPDGSTFFGGTAYSTPGWHWCSPLWTLNQNGAYKLYLTPTGLGTFGLTFTLTSAACS